MNDFLSSEGFYQETDRRVEIVLGSMKHRGYDPMRTLEALSKSSLSGKDVQLLCIIGAIRGANLFPYSRIAHLESAQKLQRFRAANPERRADLSITKLMSLFPDLTTQMIDKYGKNRVSTYGVTLDPKYCHQAAGSVIPDDLKDLWEEWSLQHALKLKDGNVDMKSQKRYCQLQYDGKSRLKDVRSLCKCTRGGFVIISDEVAKYRERLAQNRLTPSQKRLYGSNLSSEDQI